MRKPLRNNRWTINYACPHCDSESEVTVIFGCPAQTYGPPERCHPAEPDEVEPERCPNCDFAWDLGSIIAEASDDYADACDGALEAEGDARRDERAMARAEHRMDAKENR